MTNYYVFPPFEVMEEKQVHERMDELKREGRKCMAVVFGCKDYADFQRKYFKNN